ncbi:MAG: biotin--[acetyl-CoA-carboxylase] ligase [Chloroflexi bacterium]|nr:biotin--[acetyl-CoA-carboxylase] ligase [Chloroflexota bacterium]
MREPDSIRPAGQRHEDLAAFLAVAALPPGWQLLYEPVVTSTMELAHAAVARGLPGRWLFVADFQTEGRGRRGRGWTAPPGKALLLTALLPFQGEPGLALTQLVSVALCETLEALLGLEPRIKWPNDVMVDGLKVAGVLAETTSVGDTGSAVVGCGVNVNLDEADLAALPPTAGSLQLAAGHPVHRGELLLLFAERLDDWLRTDRARRSRGLRPVWEERLWGVGQLVQGTEGGLTLEGVVLGVDEDGALRLELPDGRIRRIVTGELLI